MTKQLRQKLITYLTFKYNIESYVAEDIIQDVLINVLNKKINVEHESFYFKAASNLCINYVTRNRLIPCSDKILDLYDCEYQEHKEQIPNFSILPEKQRFVVEQVYSGKKLQEIAKEYQIEYSQLRANYRIAVAKLNEFHSQQEK